jgi:hypothetical protein
MWTPPPSGFYRLGVGTCNKEENLKEQEYRKFLLGELDVMHKQYQET